MVRRRKACRQPTAEEDGSAVARSDPSEHLRPQKRNPLEFDLVKETPIIKHIASPISGNNISEPDRRHLHLHLTAAGPQWHQVIQ